jgi:hypothetical protein
MPTKDELLDQLSKNDKGQYSVKEVKHFIRNIKLNRNFEPTHLKKGDIIRIYTVKVRPAVIIKIDNNIVYCIPLSTTKDELNLCETNSRFFNNNYFTKCIDVTTYQYAIENIIGIYDNPKHLNIVIKQLEKEMLKIFGK